MNAVPKPTKPIPIKKQCDALWTACIYLRAGLRSELSGVSGELNAKGTKIVGLNAHHIAHKPNNRLRFELENGICLTVGEHGMGVHGSDPETWRARLISKIGQDKWNWLHSLKSTNGKTDLHAVRLYLSQYLNAIVITAKVKFDRPELLKAYLKQIGVDP